MEHSFWHSKWESNQIGFHEPQGNALLLAHASTLLQPANPRVFVPLCGKSKDVGWLASKGCEVIGAELSALAITQLFDELNITPKVTELKHTTLYQGLNITVFQGDIFSLSANDIGNITGVYDRAALVALPQSLRERYSAHIRAITDNAPQLLITFEYDQTQLPGPPFCVSESMVSSLYNDYYEIALLSATTLEGGLKGKVDATNLAFHLIPRL
ncbi:thiopurine S-methyltransferase [Alteromonas sp. 345S023]|uniref:Thiopurine S-methyltransferase n=1 Tax=Alteromonas profundi TaxID=2696062 RepID=A0A7X5RKT3_9ALTE|nr:thiopurine S-methyltransferase [Alteromonas profundi]NDV90989.1 thiopurine S-methyltransferase [Alteromonas profundi]